MPVDDLACGPGWQLRVRGAARREVKRFGVTGHQREMSQTMMRQIEEGLADLFGDKWTEKRVAASLSGLARKFAGPGPEDSSAC